MGFSELDDVSEDLIPLLRRVETIILVVTYLRREQKRCPETLFDSDEPTLYYNPEELKHQLRRGENLKQYDMDFISMR